MTQLTLNGGLSLLREADLRVSFERRPFPLVADLRLTWRLPLLALCLQICCRGGRSSLARLHLLNWAVRTPKSRTLLLQALDGHRRPHDMPVRLEPSLIRVIDFAAGEGLVDFPKGDRVQLATKGYGL